jgi:hypothetical protein
MVVPLIAAVRSLSNPAGGKLSRMNLRDDFCLWLDHIPSALACTSTCSRKPGSASAMLHEKQKRGFDNSTPHGDLEIGSPPPPSRQSVEEWQRKEFQQIMKGGIVGPG